MAHFARIENGIVTNVLVVDNTHEADGNAYLNSIGFEGTWVQTSYNANFGKKFAGIGDTYNEKTGEFKPAKPFSSWKFNTTDWTWEAPVAHPNDGEHWMWNEESKAWVKP